MRNHFIGAAVALIVSACGQGANVSLEPADGLLTATQEAVAVWQPTLDSCGRSLAIAYTHADGRIDFGYTGDATALTYHKPLHIYLNQAKLPDHAGLVHVLAHELGHALGAEDSNDPTDLMFRENPSAPAPNSNDAEQVCGN